MKALKKGGINKQLSEKWIVYGNQLIGKDVVSRRILSHKSHM